MKRRHEIENGRIAEAIEDLLAVAARDEQPGSAHQPQVLRGVGERQARSGRQILHAAFALRKKLQNDEPVRVSQRLRDFGELGEQSGLGRRA